MSWYAVVLLVALAALGAGDVGAVARSDRDLSRILRPAFGVLLLALAWLGRAESFAAGRGVLLAVAACTAADVALGTGRARPGRVGVLGYAVCHLGFLAALVLVPTERSTLGWVVGAVVAAVCAVALAVLLWPVLQTAAPVGVALALAVLPVVLLVGVGVASGPVAGAGALLLVLATGAAGYHRLVAPQRALAVVTTAAQHLGQVLLVLVVIGVGG